MPRKRINVPENYNAPLPTRLRDLMRASGFTQADLAGHLGISRQSVSAYMDGSANPTPTTIVSIAKFLGVSTDYLLGESQYTKSHIAQLSVEDVGLSETAVSVLQQYKQIGTNKVIKTINALLENDPYDNQNVLRCIAAYLFFEKDVERDYKITDDGLIIEKDVHEDNGDNDGMTDSEKDFVLSFFVKYLYTITDNVLFEEALFNLASTGLRQLKETLRKQREESQNGVAETENN